MSYRRRQQKILMANVDKFYEAPGGNAEAWSETDLEFNEMQMFPGPRETRFVDAANDTIGVAGHAVDMGAEPDWDVGGISGETKFVGSTGVTDPSTVDAHSFVGQMATVRRMPDTNYGPVATSDHNSLLALLYSMQEGTHYFPNEASQRDVIKAV